MTTWRDIDIELICEICEGEVDLHGQSATQGTAQCRHCGIAFAVDVLEIERLSA